MELLWRERLLVNDSVYSSHICCMTSEEHLEHGMNVIKQLQLKIVSNINPIYFRFMLPTHQHERMKSITDASANNIRVRHTGMHFDKDVCLF